MAEGPVDRVSTVASERGSLLPRLVVVVVLSLAVLVVAIAAGAYVWARGVLEHEALSEMALAVSVKGNEMQRLLVLSQNELSGLTQMSAVRTWAQIVATRNEGNPEFGPAYAGLSDLFTMLTREMPAIRQLSLLGGTFGRIVVSTDHEIEGEYRERAPYFKLALEHPYVGPAEVQPDTGRTVMVIAMPLADMDGQTIGVLAAELDLDWIQSAVLERAGLDPLWNRYLVGSDLLLITGPGFTQGPRPQLWPEAAALLRTGSSGTGVYRNDQGKQVLGAFEWLSGPNLALLIEAEYQESVVRPALKVAARTLVVGWVVSVLFTVDAYVVSRKAIGPLWTLRGRMVAVGEGDLTQQMPVKGRGEVAALAAAFNRMVTGLQQLYERAEAQARAQAASLSQRSRQLQAAAQVSRLISGSRNVPQLLNEITRLISESFGFEHVGVFLVDERREYAVLQAASSEGGQRMLARHHKLRLGQGIVGSVAQGGEPRIALDVGEDPVFFNNPDLPLTRSEMALPLMSQETVIGVLDVQSEREGAFSEEDVVVLQSIADQVALAIENAALVEEAEQTLAELRLRYREQVGQAWARRLGDQTLAYQYTGVSVVPISRDAVVVTPSETRIVEKANGTRELVAPISVRGQVLGSVVFHQEAGDEPWDEEDIALVNMVCDQIGQALESARLLDEAQRRASFEQLTGGIAERIRASATDIDGVLQTTLRELAVALHAQGQIRIHPAVESSDTSDGAGGEAVGDVAA